VIARYTSDYYAGQPAVTLNRYGAGTAIYVGTIGDAATHATLAGWLIVRTGISAPFPVPVGVELTTRTDGSRQLLFVLNHTATTQEVTLDRAYRNLLSDAAPLQGTTSLDAHAVLILEEAD
jgi:beta-galactosidase